MTEEEQEKERWEEHLHLMRSIRNSMMWVRILMIMIFIGMFIIFMETCTGSIP